MRHLLSRFKWHIVFWVAYCTFWTLLSIYAYHATPLNGFLVTLVWFVGSATCSYLSIYWLMPAYFNRRRYFVFSLLFLVLLSTAALGMTGGIWGLYQIGKIKFPVKLWQEYFSVLIGTFYTTFIIVAVKSLKDKIRSDRRAALLEKEKTENELRFLKSQMNPHFLFNAINSIYVLIKKDPDFAGHTLVKFADMLRYQLYECNADVIPIEKEISYLENYIQLEKLRKEQLVNTSFSVSASTGKFSIAPLLLIPFVENAFKYVSVCPGKNNFVMVHLNFQDNIFELSVENSIDEDAMMPKERTWGGIGLENVRRRLQLIYDGSHALDISTRDDVFSVLLTIKIA